jgi:hypothetical protein
VLELAELEGLPDSLGELALEVARADDEATRAVSITHHVREGIAFAIQDIEGLDGAVLQEFFDLEDARGPPLLLLLPKPVALGPERARGIMVDVGVKDEVMEVEDPEREERRLARQGEGGVSKKALRA